MPTMTELKKLTIGGRKTSTYSTPKLFVAEHDGAYWATNAYWLVKADRLRVMLEHFNLPTDEAATYEVNGKVARVEMDQPAIARFFEEDYATELTRTTIEGIGYVYAAGGKPGDVLAVYDRPDGERVFFGDDFHAWILSTLDESRGYGERWKAGSLKVRQRAGSVGSTGPCAFYATVEKKRGGHYGEAPEGSNVRPWIPETWETGAEELFAILMPVRRG